MNINNSKQSIFSPDVLNIEMTIQNRQKSATSQSNSGKRIRVLSLDTGTPSNK
jgi:hypothetical protein